MLSVASAAFDFNASLKDVTPESPIKVTVDEKRNEKSESLMDVFGVYSFVFTFKIEFSECCV